jgi:GT2 family glycosyltransferase
VSAARPLTSIVILTRNQLGYTRACVEGIARTTPEPHELVFVDNGSDDGTLEYLRSLPDAVVIDNGENLGFGGGCNQGIAASLGERILLLNNDVVPAPGWLGALHDALDPSPSAGLAGPRTNRIVGSQQVDHVGYDEETLDGLDAWAARWCADHAGQRTPAQRLVGFCVLLERAVVERIGGFDLRYAIGNFEDDDLSLRAAVAGFDRLVAEDSFVHHFGSRTFAGEGIDYTASIAANLRRFRDAWGIGDDDLAAGAGSYAFQAVADRTSWDDARHHAPLVGTDDTGARVVLDQPRSHVVAVCCDRVDASGTRSALDHALRTWGPDDDVTVVVRIDPRDRSSEALLDELADAHEHEGLPDVVVVQALDVDDRPVLRAVDEVVVAGRSGRARALLARRMGVSVRTAAGE